MIDRALSARPSDRFPSAAAMRAEVLLVAEQDRGLAADEEIGRWAVAARRTETPVNDVRGAVAASSGARTRLWWLAAAAVVLLGGGTLFALRARPDAPQASAAVAPSASAAQPVTSFAELEPVASVSASPTPAPKPATPMARMPQPALTSGEPAWLNIGSEPAFAYVTIDGKSVGSTPLFGVRLKPGSHVVVVQREGLGSKTITLALRPGEHVSRVVKLP